MKYFTLLLVLVSCASKPPCKGLTHNCNNGDGGACYQLGVALLNTIGKKNPDNNTTKKKSSKWMQKGCALGHKKSCEEYKQYQKYNRPKQ